MKNVLNRIVMFSLIIWCSEETVFTDDSSSLSKEGDAMRLVCVAFGEGEMIPAVYTCDGENVSPPLVWSDVPETVKSFALIADDPDAPSGTWVHWVVYNIPPDARALAENASNAVSLPDGAGQGMNDSGKPGYGGPCPPGGVHRYYFRLYALDARLAADTAMTKKKLLAGMEGHLLAEAVLMGRYRR